MVRPESRLTELGSLPGDWQVKQVSDFAPFVTSGSRGWAAFYSELGSPFIRITNLSRRCIYPDLSDLRLVNREATDGEGARTQLRDGDVLVSITADIGIIGYVTERVPRPAYINQHIALIRFDAPGIVPRFVSYFLASEGPQKLFRALTDSGAKAGMNLMTVQALRIAVPPTRVEQEAIAEALADADALIESLEQLLAKKCQIKQGAGLELLTGRRRLPGFGVSWKTMRLGDIAHIKTGSRNNEDKLSDGVYPFFVRSDFVERINTYSHDCEAVLVPGEGRIGEIFHYIRGRFDVHQRVYAITRFSPEACGQFVYFYLRQFFGTHAMKNTVKATVDSLRLPTFLSFELTLPGERREQEGIASVLSDMDEELIALETKLTKARQLKQGMMQQLLTGRIRLA